MPSPCWEITHDSAVDEIGWYELGQPQIRHTIFDASDAAGATAQVFIATNFALYYRNTATGALFFTQTAFNTAGSKPQIAAFQLNGHTILGVEEVFSNVVSQSPAPGSSDYDYNDVLVGFRAGTFPVPAPVSEPRTFLLVVTGLSAFLLKHRRRRA